MLKSRRGLLAAGLAVAVVGALGVVSTQNAGAEQIPGTSDSAAAAPDDSNAAPDDPAAATADPSAAAVAGSAAARVDSRGVAADSSPVRADPKVKPPPYLPWGARPHPLRRGRAGSSAKALQAAGMDVASADTSGAKTPPAEFGPREMPSDTDLAANTYAAPQPAARAAQPVAPLPAGMTAKSSAVNHDDEAYFFWSGAKQVAEVDGFSANIWYAKPTMVEGDYHTLAEVTVQSADEQQAVEIGWMVDSPLKDNKDSPLLDAHLFVSHWVNGQGGCYNACGYVQFTDDVKPGDVVASSGFKDDVNRRFSVQFYQNKWWVAYGTSWFGYFPAKLWADQGVTFEKGGRVQVFGEVASNRPMPCTTQMGNGIYPAASTQLTSRVSSMVIVNGPPLAMQLYNAARPPIGSPNIPLVTPYSAIWLNSKTFGYGGAQLANPADGYTGPCAYLNTPPPTTAAKP